MKNRAIALMMAAGVMTVAVGANAQPKDAAKPAPPETKAPAAAMPPAAAAPAAAPRFSDEEMGQVAAALTGSWIASVPQAGGTGAASDLVLSVAPVAARDLPDVMYAELARADALNRPFRQAIWQLHRVKGNLRLKTMEFRRVRGEMLSAAGLWAAPDQFPAIGSEDLVTTIDIELKKEGKGWKGKTPYPYPTSMSGAIEMTSEVTITPDAFTTGDTGFDASGKQVWGPDKSNPGGYTFKKHDSGVKVQRLDGGVVVIDFPSKTDGDVAKAGDKVQLNYTGYLANGWMFDSSYERGLPLTHTVGGKYNFISEGFKRSLEGVKKGTVRKAVIPGPLGFGSAGELKGKIPANATLYIDMQVLEVGPGQPNLGALPGGQPNLGAVPGQPVGVQPQPLDPNSPEVQAILKKKAEADAAKGKQPPANPTNPTSPKPPK